MNPRSKNQLSAQESIKKDFPNGRDKYQAIYAKIYVYIAT